MEASLLDIDFEAELRAFQARRVKDRSRGRHLSEILHRIVTTLDPKRFGGGAIEPAQAQFGFLFEDVWSAVMARQFGSKQIEIEKDGIFMTMDGFSARRWRVQEYKATKMSARAPIRSAKFWHWHAQAMCYSMEMGTQEVELIPYFINGAYELGGGRFGKPVVRPYLMTYTRREQMETWDLVRRVNDEMEVA